MNLQSDLECYVHSCCSNCVLVSLGHCSCVNVINWVLMSGLLMARLLGCKFQRKKGASQLFMFKDEEDGHVNTSSETPAVEFF